MKTLVATLAFLIAVDAIATRESAFRIPVSDFDPSQIEEDYSDPKWSVLDLPGRERTEYALIQEENYARICAKSHNTASGLVYAVDLDPREYDVIEWTWKVDAAVPEGDLTKKKGDDYPARIYLTFDFDPADLPFVERVKHTLIKTFTNYEIPLRALNYVWANKAAPGTVAPNPYTNWVQMVAVQSGNQNAGTWRMEMRNILDDFRNAFNEEPMNITGVAIMTDTDDTKSSATGYYGDITFRKSTE